MSSLAVQATTFSASFRLPRGPLQPTTPHRLALRGRHCSSHCILLTTPVADFNASTYLLTYRIHTPLHATSNSRIRHPYVPDIQPPDTRHPDTTTRSTRHHDTEWHSTHSRPTNPSEPRTRRRRRKRVMWALAFSHEPLGSADSLPDDLHEPHSARQTSVTRLTDLQYYI